MLIITFLRTAIGNQTYGYDDDESGDILETAKEVGLLQEGNKAHDASLLKPLRCSLSALICDW